MAAGGSRAAVRQNGAHRLYRPRADRNHLTDVFDETMRRKGWDPNRNITIEYRYTAGRQDTIASTVAELARMRLDAIVAWGPHIALEVKRATQVPLVFLITFDPVEVGLVSNLAKPEGNVTGVTSLASLEIIAKRLQLLKEATPAARSVAVLLSSEQLRSRGGKEALDAAAKEMGMELHDITVVAPSDLQSAIGNTRRGGADALYVWASGFASAFGKQIADLAIEHHMPSIHPFREGAFSGGLLAYAADLKQSAARGAEYLDRILRGTSPGQLPIEQLSKYELLINLKTAKALGLEIPPTLLARADQVIE